MSEPLPPLDPPATMDDDGIPPAKIFYYVPVARQPSPIMVESFERARAIAQNQRKALFAIALWDRGSLSIETKRNIAASTFLNDSDAEWLFMVDDDMDFRQDPEAICKLITEARKVKADIIGPLMVRRGEPHYVAFNEHRGIPDATKRAVKAWQEEETFPVTGHVGSGCLLIHRRVLQALRPPWFVTLTDWKCRKCKEVPAPDCPSCKGTGEDYRRININVGEDAYFCRYAIDAGFSCYVAAGVILGHLGEIGLTIEDALRVQHPVLHARNTLRQYEEFQKEIRAKKEASLVLPVGPSLVTGPDPEVDQEFRLALK